MRRWLAPVVIVLAVASVYGGSLAAPFVFDDQATIVDNETLRHFPPWPALVPPEDTAVSGRPLVNLSFALDYALFGLWPVGFRLVNVLLHTGNAVLVWLLMRISFARPELAPWLRERAFELATAVALLWACHPLQTEAVVYVTQRTELLAAMFFLLVLHCAWRAMQAPNARAWSLLCAAACALGTGCKETLVSAPILVAALDRAFVSPGLLAGLRRHRTLYLGLLVAELPIALQLLTQPRGKSAGLGLGISLLQSLATQGGATAWYLRLAFFPHPLSVTYNWPVGDAFTRYLAADLLVASLFVITLWCWRWRVWSALPGLFFFATLAPSSSFIPVLTEMVAERRMYLPLLSVITLVAVGAAWLVQGSAPRARALAALLCGALCIACALGARARVRDYRSPLALFQSALLAAPDNPIAMWGAASAYDELGRSSAAIALYERMAARRYPYVGPTSFGTRALFAESALYARLGDPDKAVEAMRRALAHDPDSALGRLQRAAVLVQKGRDRDAIVVLRAMLEQPFLHERVEHELGAAYLRLGDRPHAREHLERALRLAPDDVEAQLWLAELPQ